MSSCTVFVFLSLIEYAFVNVMMGDISEVERKDKATHLRNIIVTNSFPHHPHHLGQAQHTNTISGYQQPLHLPPNPPHTPLPPPHVDRVVACRRLAGSRTTWTNSNSNSNSNPTHTNSSNSSTQTHNRPSVW